MRRALPCCIPLVLFLLLLPAAQPFASLAPLGRQISPASLWKPRGTQFGAARNSYATMTISATPSTAALYSDIAAIPAIAAGFILASDAGAPHILLRRNQKDLKNDEARSHVLSFAPGPSGELQPAPFPWETLQVSAMSPSPSGKFVALVPPPNRFRNFPPSASYARPGAGLARLGVTAGRRVHAENKEPDRTNEASLGSKPG